MLIDILFTFILLLSFYWLMKETRWMTVVILYGSPPKYIDVSGLVGVAIGVIAYVLLDAVKLLEDTEDGDKCNSQQ